MVLDMSGYQNRADLIRPLTAQEQKQLNSPPPELMVKSQLQQQKLQAQGQLQGQKSQTQMQIEQMKQDGKFQGEQMKHRTALAQAFLQPALSSVLQPDKEN